MRIAIDATLARDQFTGVQTCIFNLVENLVVQDSENEYVIYTGTPEGAENNRFAAAQLKTSSLPTRMRPVRIFWQQVVLPFLLKRDRIDLLHAPAYVSPVLTTTPTVVTIPDTIALTHPHLCNRANRIHFRLMLSRVARKAAQIVTVSNYSRQEIIRELGVDSARVTVIYNGVHESFGRVTDDAELKRVRSAYNLPSRYILYVGALEAKKNIIGIVAAFGLLKQKSGIPQRLVIVGQDFSVLASAQRRIATLGLETDVFFPGYVARADLPAVYTMADVFVFPSFCEGFGIPPVEAMACGVPVVTSNRSASREICEGAAFLVEPESPEEISSAIAKILGDESLRDKLVESGFRRSSQFSWVEAATQTADVYRSVLQTSKKRFCVNHP